jgi:hypothetical protein
MRLAALGALLLLAGCQPLPHPFAHDVPHPSAATEILTPPDSVGVIVESVAGAPEPAAHDLAEAMATALQKQDVPASTSVGNRDSFRLSGRAIAKPVGNSDVLVTVSWELREASGLTRSRQDAALTLPVNVWRHGGGALAVLASQSAPFFAKSVESTGPAPTADSDMVVAVRTVTGAPGDGAQSLARAMSDALRRAHVALVETPEDKAGLVLEGVVDVMPASGGTQQVKIAWSLLRANGARVGEVKQQNAVPAGSLDGPWGLTAYNAANAAAPGIAALITELRRAGSRS